MNLKLIAVAALIVFGLVSAAGASTTVVIELGKLKGADGVDVLGKKYDVRFAEGTCVTLFTGCDAPSDFAFTDSTTARAAGQALLDHVLLGIFDTDQYLTFGTQRTVTDAASRFMPTYIMTPYRRFVGALGASDPTLVFVVEVANWPGRSTNDGVDADRAFSISANTANDSNRVYAQWTPLPVPPTDVPLPAGGVLLLSGFAGLVALRRRRAGKAAARAGGRPAVRTEVGPSAIMARVCRVWGR